MVLDSHDHMQRMEFLQSTEMTDEGMMFFCDGDHKTMFEIQQYWITCPFCGYRKNKK